MKKSETDKLIEQLEGEARGRATAEAELGKDMREKVKAEGRVLADIRVSLEKARAVYADLVAGYGAADVRFAGEARAELEAEAAKKAAVETGMISVEEFLARPSAGSIEAEAKKSAKDRLAELLPAVRAAGLKVLELELQEVESLVNLSFCEVAPVQAGLQTLEARKKALEMELTRGFTVHSFNMSLREQKRADLARAKGEALTGEFLRGLTLDDLRRLRFNPKILEKQLPDLEAVIEEIEAKTASAESRRGFTEVLPPLLVTIKLTHDDKFSSWIE